jgi:hypothetical protein
MRDPGRAVTAWLSARLTRQRGEVALEHVWVFVAILVGVIVMYLALLPRISQAATA